MTTMGTLYRQSGLGSVVREVWKAEGLSPPQGLNNLQVWDWLTRSDVAASLAIGLVPDVRLCIVAVASMTRQVVRFLGGAPYESLERAQLAAYGVDEGLWRASLVGVNQESVRRLQQPTVQHAPGGDHYRIQDWLTEALAAAMNVSNAVHLLSERTPPQVVRQQLYDAAGHAWMGLRGKLRDVDGRPDIEAQWVANQLLLDELRKVINPGCFSSVYLWERKQ